MKHFDYYEFDSPDVDGSGQMMDKDFLEMLDEARAIADVSFTINSGYRTKAHNEKVGGKPESSHLKGLAADIKCKDSRSRYIILDALFQVGFTRIGIANSFIHVDADFDKSQNVIWTYKNK